MNAFNPHHLLDRQLAREAENQRRAEEARITMEAETRAREADRARVQVERLSESWRGAVTSASHIDGARFVVVAIVVGAPPPELVALVGEIRSEPHIWCELCWLGFPKGGPQTVVQHRGKVGFFPSRDVLQIGTSGGSDYMITVSWTTANAATISVRFVIIARWYS